MDGLYNTCFRQIITYYALILKEELEKAISVILLGNSVKYKFRIHFTAIKVFYKVLIYFCNVWIFFNVFCSLRKIIQHVTVCLKKREERIGRGE